jgi:hypothetical protein
LAIFGKNPTSADLGQNQQQRVFFSLKNLNNHILGTDFEKWHISGPTEAIWALFGLYFAYFD